MKMHDVPATSFKGMLAKIPAYLRARGVLLMNLCILAVLTGVMLAAADWLLRHDVWINPLPLIIGMSIKGLLAASRRAVSDRCRRDLHRQPAPCRPLIAKQVLVLTASHAFQKQVVREFLMVFSAVPARQPAIGVCGSAAMHPER
jgi:hypothetical protein